MGYRLKISEKHLNILKNLLLCHVPQAEVWVYGSRVKETAHAGSDLDIVLRNPENLETSFPQSTIKKLKTAFQESDIPFLIDLHDWALVDPKFQTIIEDEKIVLLKK